jgi:thiamine biosynthesis lipoprotein
MRRTFETMGTVADIEIRRSDLSDDALNDVLEAVERRLAELDDKFSTYKPDSEISRLGRGELSLEDASPDVRFIMDLCDKLRDLSDGAFDVYAAATKGPAAELQQSSIEGARPIEPSGAVKGWAIEVAVGLLRNAGVRDFCVNIGGDLYASGKYEGNEGWRIGLQHPSDKTKVMAVLEISNTAIATSALYERGDHIVTTAPSNVVSVTVISSDITLADAYATIAFAKGDNGPAWVAEQPGFEVFAVDDQQQTYFSPALQAFLR